MKKTLGPISTLVMCAFMASACNQQNYSLPEASQEFAQEVTYNNKVDILVMVDNSSSMDAYQSKLSSEVPGMVSALNNLGLDYHIAVVTTDIRAGGNGGVFVGSPKILTSTNPQLVSLLTSRIRQGNGGSDFERGLQSIRTALENESGFIREDAVLAILSLSNEDDYSDGGAEVYKNFFDRLKPKFKGTQQSWILNFIGVPSLSSTCSSSLDGTYKEPGKKWIALAEASGGLVQPICETTLAKGVENIRRRIVQVLTDFPLNRKPVVDTILVHINGKVVARSNENGWDYLAETNSIRFYGAAVPAASDRISVDFKPAEAM